MNVNRQNPRANAALSLAALSLVGLSLTGCPSRPTPPPGTVKGADCVLVPEEFGPKGTVSVKVETVATGLEVPWGIAFLPGGDMLVTERPGRVRLLRAGKLLPSPVASPSVSASSEGGLLGIAVHPAFANNRFFYLYMTVEEGGDRFNRVERWRLSDDGLTASKEKLILDRIPGEKYHDGGRLRFGPDGHLYIGTGDARSPELSQDKGSLAGKILRVTADGDVPADNPFPGQKAFLTGIRNTQGFDWLDASTLIVTDHGPSGDTGRSGHDELNVAQKGQNLGWPLLYSCEAKSGFVTPLLTWDKAAPPGGAAIYTGDLIPEWKGSVIIGTLGSRHLHRAVIDPKDPSRITSHEVYFKGDPPEGYGRLRDVIMGPDGALYVTTSNCDSRGDCPDDKDRILRIAR
jgi:glucose/arabinose dehydrogenase